MIQSRRSLLAALGASLPLGLVTRKEASAKPEIPAVSLGFRPFEESVREAFANFERADSDAILIRRRLEVGPSEQVQAGVQGCHNDRPFAGFPAGHLRIVRTGSEPGPETHGVRLFIATVDVVMAGVPHQGEVSRPLDFSSLPPAPIFS